MSGVKLLLQHVLLCIRYYFHRSSWCCGANNWHITKYLNQFIERRWWNSTKNYSPFDMIQDLKNQITIFEPDALLSGKDWKQIKQKNFSNPKK